MKLTSLGVLLACALSFAQTNLQIQSPSGTTQLSADSMSKVADEVRIKDQQTKLAILQAQLTALNSTYTSGDTQNRPYVDT